MNANGPVMRSEVALFGEMARKLGKNDVWWCPALTLRVLMGREEPPGCIFRKGQRGA